MIIWIILALGLAGGLALFFLFFKIALDTSEFSEIRGFWRKFFAVLSAMGVALLLLYLYSHIS